MGFNTAKYLRKKKKIELRVCRNYEIITRVKNFNYNRAHYVQCGFNAHACLLKMLIIPCIRTIRCEKKNNFRITYLR